MRFHVENQKYSGAQIIVFNSPNGDVRTRTASKVKMTECMIFIIWLNQRWGTPTENKVPIIRQYGLLKTLDLAVYIFGHVE